MKETSVLRKFTVQFDFLFKKSDLFHCYLSCSGLGGDLGSLIGFVRCILYRVNPFRAAQQKLRVVELQKMKGDRQMVVDWQKRMTAYEDDKDDSN
ncbi:hypothetical protein E3N88_17679 [Mikania micrantha]|uniref:Uncharacterized protein n=1 Tax=Mikania micrantha TaxID=192012 RepID=A0A5N6NUC0_9ASTR|nr:hypothetical protein E3N88_17679 [Mikania micrantha]